MLVYAFPVVGLGEAWVGREELFYSEEISEIMSVYFERRLLGITSLARAKWEQKAVHTVDTRHHVHTCFLQADQAALQALLHRCLVVARLTKLSGDMLQPSGGLQQAVVQQRHLVHLEELFDFRSFS